MNNCQYRDNLSRYYDGEVSLEEMARFKAHLQSCDACAEAYGTFSAMSALLQADQVPEMPRGMLNRLHNRVNSARDMELVRACRWPAAIAAAILICCLGFSGVTSPVSEPVAAPQTWEVAAVTLNSAIADQTASEVLTGWTAEDLSRGNYR